MANMNARILRALMTGEPGSQRGGSCAERPVREWNPYERFVFWVRAQGCNDSVYRYAACSPLRCTFSLEI